MSTGDPNARAERDQRLEEAAAGLLGLDPGSTVPADASFIRLGGDSLLAMRLGALSLDEFGLRLSMRSLLSDVPLREALAAAVPVADGERPRTGAGPGGTDLPTAVEEGLWAADRTREGTALNLVFTAFAEGPLRAADLEDAVAGVVARHEGLRTAFEEVGGRLRRRVLPDWRPPIERPEPPRAPAEFAPFVRGVAAELGTRPLPTGPEPALRFVVCSTGTRHAVVMIAHHILLDGWSVGTVLEEIFTAGGPADDDRTDAAPGVGAPDRWPRGDAAYDRYEKAWRERLDGVPTVLDLPADRGRPARWDPAGARLPMEIDEATTAQVTAAARHLGVTPFSVLLGAYGLTLARYTGMPRLIVGVPSAARPTTAAQGTVAVVTNVVPVRVDVDDDASVPRFLRDVHDSLAWSLDHDGMPFAELVRRLGLTGTVARHPLVQVTLSRHDRLVRRHLRAGSLQVRIEEGHGGGAQFDLSLAVQEFGVRVLGSLEFATAVWTPREAAGFLEDFTTAVADLAGAARGDGKDRRVEDVRCIAPANLARLAELNATSAPCPDTSIEELFLARVHADPEAVAVRDERVRLTYAGLAAAAAWQARRLAEAGVRPGDNVLLSVPRSAAEVVAALGVLWAGAAYAGVDPAAPPNRVAEIVARTRPAAAIASGGTPPDAYGEVPRVEPWDARRPADPGETMGPVAAPSAERLAYVAFTSGSTGGPKGVRVPHRGVIRLVHEVGYLRLGPGARMLRLAPLAFDASTLEIWGPLLTGGTIEVYEADMPTPDDLRRYIARRGVTVAWITSGLFRVIAEVAPDAYTGLRQLLTGGDVVPAGHVARVRERAPHLEIVNGYGPTENTTFSTVHVMRSDADVTDPLPIGRPVPNTRVHVLDRRARLVPPGGAGELYVAGKGLANGYLGRPEETAARFGRLSPDVPEDLYRTGDRVRLDGDGRLRFLGRDDDQVKIRGHRVEPGEIERVLAAHPDVQDAVVVATAGPDRRLVAGCVLARPDALEDVHDFLAGRLPGYMVPQAWSVVPRIPVTPNGKVERDALIASAGPLRAGAPGQDRGTVLAGVRALTAEVLGLEDVGDDDDFFTAGGDSLAAVRLVALVKERYGAEPKVRDYLLDPTPTGLTRLIERGRSG